MMNLSRLNVYSCSAYDIDSGRTRVAGGREHDDMPRPTRRR